MLILGASSPHFFLGMYHSYIRLWTSAELEYEYLGFPHQLWTLSVVEVIHHFIYGELLVVTGEKGRVVLPVTHEHHNA